MNPNQVLAIARADIGYKEGPNNDTLAGKFTGANFQPWCASWIAFTFHRAGCPKLYPKRLVNCNDALAYFAKLGQLVPIDQAMPGDLIFFGNPLRCSHVGLHLGNGRYLHSSGISHGRNGIGIDALWASDKHPVASHYRAEIRGAGRVQRCHDGSYLP